jgi:hypothetical protein
MATFNFQTIEKSEALVVLRQRMSERIGHWVN